MRSESAAPGSRRWQRGGRTTAAAIAAAAVLASTQLGCGKGAEAIAAASVAGAITLAEAAARAAATDAERPPAREGCDHEGHFGCYADSSMTLEEAREHALLVINQVRTQENLPPFAADFGLTAFAQDGSKQLSRDHVAHAHVASNLVLCPGCIEVQSNPDGWPSGPVGDQIDGILDDMVSEGPGGSNHDVLLGTRWHRIGVGIANPGGGPLYLTMDVAP